MTEGNRRKVAVVTGASSGIGRATAAAFISQGYATALLDCNEAAGRKVQARLNAGGECIFIPCDVVDDAQVGQAIDQTVATFGRLDVAFNGAGIDGAKGMMTGDAMVENWHRVIAVNLTGVWQCMRHQLRAMLASGGGAIVNCSSIAGMVGAPALAAYVAAKHGVLGLTKSAALEYARQGVRINAVCPGIIDTPMTRLSSTPEELAGTIEYIPTGRMGTPEEIAAAAVWLCGDGASYITGQALAIDGAWTSR
jgi:NAD(P)-dependent dehydrogenase (short-subunit alcohol dehydrogenase family)